MVLSGYQLWLWLGTSFLPTLGPHLNLTFETFSSHTGATEKPVPKLRVLVANRPRLMRELVLATIEDQPDFEIVGETDNESEITEMVERTRPDYLIVGREESRRSAGVVRFLAWPVSANGNSGSGGGERQHILLGLRGHPLSGVETSEDGMLNALRGKSELVSM